MAKVLLDELVTKFGIDVDTEKLKAFVGAIGNAAKTIADKANQANAALQKVNDNAVTGAQQAGEQAKEAEKPLNRLRLLALGVTTVIGAATAKVLGFVVGAIGGAHDLAQEKGLLYQISARELAQADAYQESLKRSRLAIESVRTKIALNLVPSLTLATEGFNQWLTANKDLVTGGITRVIQAAGKVVQVIINSYRALDTIIASTLGWRNALLLLGVALVVVKRAMLAAFIANPVTWVIAAIAGLMLLLDDLMVYLKGGKSQFGAFWKPAIAGAKQAISWFQQWYASIAPLITKIVDIFSRELSAIWKIFRSFFSYLISAVQLVYGLLTGNTEQVKKAWRGMADAIANMWEGLKAFFSAWVEGIALLFSGVIAAIIAIWEGLKTAVGNIFSVLSDLAGEAVEELKTTFSRITDAIIAPFKAAFDEVVRYYDKTIGKLSGAWDSLKGGASKAWNALGLSDNEAAAGIVKTVNQPNLTAAPRVGGDTYQTSQRSATINGGPVNITNNISTSEPNAVTPLIERGVEKGYSRALLSVKGAVQQ